MAVSSCLQQFGIFPSSSVVRSSTKVDLFANILPTSLSPAISPYPAISLKLGPGSQRTAALPVQAQHGCASSESDDQLVFYPHRFVQVLTLLRTLPDVRTRCRQIVRYGQQLPLAPTTYVTDANRVEGLPNTYLHALLDPSDPSLVYFFTHSDAAHIRGLAIILVAGLSWSPVQTIADMSLTPFMLLLGQTLLPARWCTQFLLLLEHMQRKARQLLIANTTGSSNKHVVEDVLSIMGLGSSSLHIPPPLKESEIDNDKTRVVVHELLGRDDDGSSSLHIPLKDEIDKTRVVHELLGRDDGGNDVHVDCDDDGDDVNLDVGRQKYDENSFDYDDDDGLSWRVKKYPPMHTVYCDDDGTDSIASTIPRRWG